MDGTVLLADDDHSIRTVLTQALTRAGCRVHATSSLTTLMRWVAEGKGDVVITDVMMPDGNGLELLPKIALDRPDLPVIVISAQNTIMTAIQATEARAFDYLPKPFDLPDLLHRTARALERHPRQSRGGDSAPRPDEPVLVGRSAVMQALYKLVARVMNTGLPLMITGESGTGKSLLAKAVHDLSDRHAAPFVILGEAQLEHSESPDRVLERAGSGSILFEEIGDFSAAAQARILRMIDGAGPASARYIATSRIAPATLLAQGLLRDDLFYRLNGAGLHLPALRDRVEDIALLAAHKLEQCAADGQEPHRLSSDATKRLRAYDWPGNVRQLDQVLRGLAATAQTRDITGAEAEAALGTQPDVRPRMSAGDSGKLSESVALHLRRYFDLHGNMLPPPGLHGRFLREIELPLIEIALDATGGNQAKCADLLGINRNTLRKKMAELDIRVTRRRKLM